MIIQVMMEMVPGENQQVVCKFNALSYCAKIPSPDTLTAKVLLREENLAHMCANINVTKMFAELNEVAVMKNGFGKNCIKVIS